MRGAGSMPEYNIKLARNLRARQTETEQKLWYQLRDRRFMGLKFRRQVSIGKYIVDFYCHAHKLFIELDGSQHLDSEQDKLRDQYLSEQNLTIMRFWNNQIHYEIDSVLEAIKQTVEPSPPTPLPEGEGSMSTPC